jgi:hypothetical protein
MLQKDMLIHKSRMLLEEILTPMLGHMDMKSSKLNTEILITTKNIF